MANGSDPQSPSQPQSGNVSETTSLQPGPNGSSESLSSGEILSASPDADRIPLPAEQETTPAHIRKRSEFLGLRRGLDALQVLLVLVFAVFSASFAIRNSDFFLHLATGRALSQGTYQFGVDPFSYTTQGIYWVNHSWLYDFAVYPLFNWVGGAGLVVIKGILVALLAIVMLQIRRKDQSIWIPVLCTGLAILALSPRLFLNPALVSYLFLAITLCLLTWRSKELGSTLESKSDAEPTKSQGQLGRALGLIVLVGLWANLDAWFILGPITIGLFLLGEVIDGLLAPVEQGRTSSRAKERQWLALALAGSLAVCLLNPHHIKVFELPIELSIGVPSEISKNPSFSGIFQSPWVQKYWKTPEINVAAGAYFPLVLLGILSFLANSRNFSWWRLLVWGAFLVASTLRARTVPFFAIVSGPILALNFQDFALAVWPKLRDWGHGLIAWLVWGRVLSFLALLALVAAAWPGLLYATPQDNRHVNWVLESDKSLERAALELKQLRHEGVIQEGDHGFTLATEFGYYCAWYCPEEKGFVDSRIQLFPASVWQDFFTMQSAIRPSAQLAEQQRDEYLASAKANDEIKRQFFQTWNINHVTYLFESAQRDSQAPLLDMGTDPKQWTLLALKGRSAIFGWHDPQKPETANRFASHAYDADREAFGALSSKNLLPTQPIPQTQRGDDWVEKIIDLAYAKPMRSVDGDEANLHLVYSQVLNFLDAQRAQRQLIAAQAVMAMGYGFGLPAPSCLITMCKWHLANALMPGSIQPPIMPASALLAIRSARRALADKESAATYLNLAKAYLSLPESANWRDLNNPGFLVSSLRRIQAVSALRAAITLDPDLVEAQLLLFQYFSGERFNYQAAILGRRNRPAPFDDLALQHLSKAIEILRAQNRRESRDILEGMETQEKELEQRVRTAKNEWLVQTNNPNMPLLEKAIQAGFKGLAGEALKTLESASVPELTSSDNLKSPFDLDLDGIRIQLDLELRCGKTSEVFEALYTNESSLTKNPRLKEMGLVLLPCYKWIAVEYAAAVGKFAEADSILKDMIDEARLRNGQELAYYASLFLGVNGAKQIDSFPAMLLMQMPRPQPIGLTMFQRMVLGSTINTYRRVSLVPREEADLSVIRGELALELGDTVSAREHFEHAHILANPPAYYLKPMTTFGHTGMLPILAATASSSYVNAGQSFTYPLQDWTGLYLKLLQAQDESNGKVAAEK